MGVIVGGDKYAGISSGDWATLEQRARVNQRIHEQVDISRQRWNEAVAALEEAPLKGGMKTDLLDGASSEERKKYPVHTGFNNYFRNAIMRVARVSYDGNEKHNPGTSTHWARGKSMDQLDCLARHTLVAEDEEHLANAAWRAMAELEIFLEKKYNISPPPGARSET